MIFEIRLNYKWGLIGILPKVHRTLLSLDGQFDDPSPPHQHHIYIQVSQTLPIKLDISSCLAPPLLCTGKLPPNRFQHFYFWFFFSSIFLIISASSSSICLSILAPREGSFPCIVAGSVGSISPALVSSDLSLPDVSSFWGPA